MVIREMLFQQIGKVEEPLRHASTLDLISAVVDGLIYTFGLRQEIPDGNDGDR
jgi:hypothetical protein